MGKKQPKAPDPRQTSAAATGTNIGTTVANNMMQNVNEVTPDGTKTFSQSGSYSWTDPYTRQTYQVPQFTLNQTLSPQQQAIKAQQDRADLNLSTLGADQSARIGGILGNDIDMAGLPSAPGSPPRAGQFDWQIGDAGGITKTYGTDFSADRAKVEGALMSRLNPQLDRDRDGLRTQLANQGIREGSEAFDRAMSRFGEQSNDARMQAILAGGQEQSRLVGLEAQRAGFENAAQGQQFAENQARSLFSREAGQQNYANQMTEFNAQNSLRDRALQETFALRNQPINEIAALMSGSQVSMPQFMTGAQVNAAPITDNAALINTDYQNRLGAWQAKNSAIAQNASAIGGLFGGYGAMRG